MAKDILIVRDWSDLMEASHSSADVIVWLLEIPEGVDREVLDVLLLVLRESGQLICDEGLLGLEDEIECPTPEEIFPLEVRLRKICEELRSLWKEYPGDLQKLYKRTKVAPTTFSLGDGLDSLLATSREYGMLDKVVDYER